MTRAKLQIVAKSIASTVNQMHEGRKSWNKLAGQWLVYGFEAVLGFGGAVTLESAVERAYRARTDLETAAFESLVQLYTEAGKMED